MSLEISVRAESGDKVLYEDFLCGRDNATLFLAHMVEAAHEDDDEPDWEAVDDEVLDSCSLIYNVDDAEDMRKLEWVLSELRGYAEADMREVRKAEEELEDLRAARRNARTIENFCGFSDDLERTRDWLEHESFSRASALIGYITAAREAAKSAPEDGGRRCVRIVA